MSAKKARKSKNLFDENSEKVSGYVNNQGIIVQGEYLIWTYDYFPIIGGATYTFISYDASNTNIIRIAWYDANKTFISRTFEYANVAGTVAAPLTAAYARLSIDDAVDDVMFNEGSTALPYEPYNATILEPCAVKRYHNDAWIDAEEYVRHNGAWDEQ